MSCHGNELNYYNPNEENDEQQLEISISLERLLSKNWVIENNKEYLNWIECKQMINEQTEFLTQKKNLLNLEISKDIDFQMDNKPKEKSHFNKRLLNIEDINSLENKKLLGKKKNNSNELETHDKYSYDNLSRKCKYIIIDKLILFINNILIKLYKGDIGKGTNELKLLKLNQKEISSSKADYNLALLNNSIKGILSAKISKKYFNHSPEHNKVLIEKLLNEKDVEKRIFFEKLFNLRFLDCLNHFGGKVNVKELGGFPSIETVCEEFKKYKDYIKYVTQFKSFINNYEDIFKEKKVRNRKSNKKIKS